MNTNYYRQYIYLFTATVFKISRTNFSIYKELRLKKHHDLLDILVLFYLYNRRSLRVLYFSQIRIECFLWFQIHPILQNHLPYKQAKLMFLYRLTFLLPLLAHYTFSALYSTATFALPAYRSPLLFSTHHLYKKRRL